MYNTRSLKSEDRTQKINGLGHFNECEYCKASEPLPYVNIKYYDRYKKVLCDRCVDNHDGVTPWTNKFAAERGLPPYLKM